MEEREIIYYEMLENVHVVFKEERFNFWSGEIYEPSEFLEAALDIEELLKQGKCKRFLEEERKKDEKR